MKKTLHWDIRNWGNTSLERLREPSICRESNLDEANKMNSRAWWTNSAAGDELVGLYFKLVPQKIVKFCTIIVGHGFLSLSHQILPFFPIFSCFSLLSPLTLFSLFLTSFLAYFLFFPLIQLNSFCISYGSLNWIYFYILVVEPNDRIITTLFRVMKNQKKYVFKKFRSRCASYKSSV